MFKIRTERGEAFWHALVQRSDFTDMERIHFLWRIHYQESIIASKINLVIDRVRCQGRTTVSLKLKGKVFLCLGAMVKRNVWSIKCRRLKTQFPLNLAPIVFVRDRLEK